MKTAVDAVWTSGYFRRSRFPLAFGSSFLVAALAVAGCASAPVSPAGPVDVALERRAVEATAPAGAFRILFDWSAREGESRFGGRGVARVEQPERVRLDLVGPRGEAILSAALVGHSLHLPAGANTVAVPPPPLLWSVLGVFSPPPDARLVATRQDDGRVTLEYDDADGARWRFVLQGDTLRRAELDAPGQGRRTVELQGNGPRGLPQVAVYRDWTAFRELTLTLDQVHDAESFPADIWMPASP